jgi:hypothetical protein
VREILAQVAEAVRRNGIRLGKETLDAERTGAQASRNHLVPCTECWLPSQFHVALFPVFHLVLMRSVGHAQFLKAAKATGECSAVLHVDHHSQG